MPTPELNEMMLFQRRTLSLRTSSTPFIPRSARLPRSSRLPTSIEIRGGAEAEPLVLLVVMERQPVGDALVLDEAEEPWLPVVAQIVVGERESARAASENADLVAAHARVAGCVTFSPPSTRMATPASRVRIGARRRAVERRAGEVDGDVDAANRDRGGVERRRARRDGNVSVRLAPICVMTRPGRSSIVGTCPADGSVVATRTTARSDPSFSRFIRAGREQRHFERSEESQASR